MITPYISVRCCRLLPRNACRPETSSQANAPPTMNPPTCACHAMFGVMIGIRKLMSIQISMDRMSMPMRWYTTRIAANRPNSAPEAPYADVSQPSCENSAQTIMPALPPSPDSTYNARYGRCPIMRSNTGPTHHKVSMLKRMCHREAGWCRNIDVMKVHGR